MSFPVQAMEIETNFPLSFAFEAISQDEQESTMAWNGTLGQILQNLGSIMLNETIRPQELVSRFWSPALLVRAAVDMPKKLSSRPELIRDATKLALNVYAGIPDRDLLESISERVESQGLQGRRVRQKHDLGTALAIKPEYAQESASCITQLTGGPVVLVPVCHGGLVPGVETFLYYSRDISKDISIYPVRLSREKHGDKEPRLSQKELRGICEASEGAAVVVFDEDAYAGETIAGVIRHLSRHTHGEMFGLVNYDTRGDDIESEQGLNWELVAARS